MHNPILDRIAAGKTTVLGLGISNLPLIDFLLARGARVTVRDRKPRAEIAQADALEAKGVHFITGEGYLDGEWGDVIFRSPGIRPDLPQIAAAVAGGALLFPYPGYCPRCHRKRRQDDHNDADLPFA